MVIEVGLKHKPAGTIQICVLKNNNCLVMMMVRVVCGQGERDKFAHWWLILSETYVNG